MHGMHRPTHLPDIPVQVGGIGVEGGFHGGDSLPILEGSHPVAPATDE